MVCVCVMNGTHTFHNFSRLNELNHPSDKETLSLEKQETLARAPCFPLSLLRLSAAAPPTRPVPFHSLFPYLSCNLYELTRSRWARRPRNGKIPKGEVATAGWGVHICVCASVHMCVWPSSHPCRVGPLCQVTNFKTPSFSCALRFLTFTSLSPPTHTFMEHINLNPTFIIIMGKDHSFFPQRKTTSELSSTKLRALAVADRDAAVNSEPSPHALVHPAVVSPVWMEITPRCLHVFKNRRRRKKLWCACKLWYPFSCLFFRWCICLRKETKCTSGSDRALSHIASCISCYRFDTSGTTFHFTTIQSCFIAFSCFCSTRV